MKKATIPEKMTALSALAGKGKPSTHWRRVLAYLEAADGGMNRLDADDIGVMHLARRIRDLKDRGYTIKKRTENAMDRQGRLHRNVARYFLTGYPIQEAA